MVNNSNKKYMVLLALTATSSTAIRLKVNRHTPNLDPDVMDDSSLLQPAQPFSGFHTPAERGDATSLMFDLLQLMVGMLLMGQLLMGQQSGSLKFHVPNMPDMASKVPAWPTMPWNVDFQGRWNTMRDKVKTWTTSQQVWNKLVPDSPLQEGDFIRDPNPKAKLEGTIKKVFYNNKQDKKIVGMKVQWNNQEEEQKIFRKDIFKESENVVSSKFEWSCEDPFWRNNKDLFSRLQNKHKDVEDDDALLFEEAMKKLNLLDDKQKLSIEPAKNQLTPLLVEIKAKMGELQAQQEASNNTYWWVLFSMWALQHAENMATSDSILKQTGANMNNAHPLSGTSRFAHLKKFLTADGNVGDKLLKLQKDWDAVQQSTAVTRQLREQDARKVDTTSPAMFVAFVFMLVMGVHLFGHMTTEDYNPSHEHKRAQGDLDPFVFKIMAFMSMSVAGGLMKFILPNYTEKESAALQTSSEKKKQ